MILLPPSESGGDHESETEDLEVSVTIGAAGLSGVSVIFENTHNIHTFSRPFYCLTIQYNVLLNDRKTMPDCKMISSSKCYLPIYYHL